MAFLKILKPSFADPSTTDIWKFIFNSNFPTFKIATSGSQNFTITAGNNEAYIDINHNLNYNPIYFANILKNSFSFQVPADMDSGIEVDNDSGYTSAIRFYSKLTSSNTLRIGAYTADGVGVNTNEVFTGYWLINLDDFKK